MREVPAMSSLFDAMRAASRHDQTPPWDVRADRLRRLRRLVQANHDAIAAAISADFTNRPHQETALLEVFPSVAGIDDALRHGKRWMRVRRASTGLWFKPGRSRLMPQPLGVVGIVVPWNYPLYLTIGPLTGALAAGNRAMVKLSEYTPRFSALFAQLVQAAFAPDEVAVINGDAEVAAAFSTLPFDHLLFTGSTNVGHHVMRAAAANLTPVTLELGGKSPAIIGPHADFERAVERILVGKLLNAGQTCIAPDYVLVQADQRDRFAEAARRCASRLYPDIARNPDYTSIISPRHFDRLVSMIAAATAAGAHAVPLTDATPDAAARRLPPVLLTDVPDNVMAMQEEIFGPVLPVVTYRSIEDAIGFVNARPRPLALYVFDKSGDVVDRVMRQTVAGGVTVNDTLFHIAQDDLPFGGVGPSGMGVYHGKAGFETFSKLKPIFHQAGLNGAGLLKPPYGKRFESMLKLLLR
ncbi:coniferyl-aldehyde dehydrogenase [Cupriavidus metallidurans]|jgi:coniferyl-aldehyde dehydrogenase|uniref:Aldehyde dehydrogenase n=1 Tax=Cupriavidus metallidurans (strain ATCC 43123 / DSM 2839 / NBRC 102507 / CH34) TaxID=266264 RepID=Q1LS32_CUPMC|nr:coniferyl aldehyde dehydrogenase [Cupriavidus metallidurans]ABF07044.1 NAD-dependent aldehyde dehydrogenase [Cupriavidus metallidurans CH34]AVA32268.1 coniferyl aldehyde dehydrogenase [Cupriavidus metallidurans]KWW34022.1 Coniferyl aldehyde dehydrogenase [Cupriavidus metallidurans]MDE4916467.1 coniferyl aldehyde dehydrogenase [Cupriavidus metallidurans]QGS28603.1 aldehyde dehydrogenase family protein [Cupriavidus metallidurans]